MEAGTDMCAPLQCPAREYGILLHCWKWCSVFTENPPDERLGFQLYFVALAICNVWDCVFMPGSGGYLLLMFMIKILHICLIFCRGHKSTVARGKNKAVCFANMGSVA